MNVMNKRYFDNVDTPEECDAWNTKLQRDV